MKKHCVKFLIWSLALFIGFSTEVHAQSPAVDTYTQYKAWVTLKVLGEGLPPVMMIALGTGGLTSSNRVFGPQLPTQARSISQASKVMPSNRLNHIFGKSEHALESLITKFGSQEGAYNAVQNAANQALKTGRLTPNAKGILPSGDLGNIINVGGVDIRLIGGRVENGQVILSSFSRKGL